ncbi:MAG TPA: ketohexokinase [Gammaproteobacteria bacterium]|nr:ketohexokinase [Gammaproteobacteria bacterium]
MKIVAVGIATLDVINRVERYPAEDSEVRVLSQRRCRGGNATNTLTVLSQLGHDCAWAGVLPQGPDAAYIEEVLSGQQIDLRHVRRLTSGKLPTSYITLSDESGSRTIMHLRDLPEYRAEWFLEGVDPEEFQWIHFEGRDPDELEVMLSSLSGVDGLRVSVEIEKPRSGIEALFHLPEVLLFSRHYALSAGCDNAQSLLKGVAQQLGEQRPLLFCAWGDKGAWALDRHGELLHAPAVRLTSIVDTVAAGDVFNAAVIHALAQGESPMAALVQGCQLAGLKCGMEGVEDIFR